MKQSKDNAVRKVVPIDEPLKLSATSAELSAMPPLGVDIQLENAREREHSRGRLVCNADLNIVEADESGASMLGYDRAADLLQHKLADLLRAPDQGRLHRGLENILTGRAESFSGELRIQRRNADCVWMRWTVRKISEREAAAPQRLGVEIVSVDTLEGRELRLTNQERVLSQALSHASVGMLIGSPSGRPLLVNQAMCDILGYDMSEVLNLRYAEVTHAGDIELAREAFRQLYAREINHYHDEKRFIRKDGSVVWVSQGISIARDEATDEPIAVVVQAQTIDAAAKYDAISAKGNRLTSGGSAHSTVGFVLTEADGAIVQANAVFADMACCDRVEIQGKNLLQFIEAEERAELRAAMQRLCHGEVDNFRRPVNMHDKQGNISLVLLAGSAASGAAGSAPKLLWQIVDIDDAQNASARVRMLEELHEAKELAQVTIASVAEGLIRTDIDGRITLCNEAAARLLGIPSREMRGAPFAKLVGFVDHRNGRRLPDPVTAVLRHGQPIKLGPYAGLKCRDGRVRPIIDSTAPLRGLDGRMIGTVVIIQDATETFVLTERLAAQAYRDDLTRLPNRRAFEDHIAERLRAKRSAKRWDFLLFVDLDHFKVVNDTCGHATGDELLHEMALMLRSQIRETDFVARLGGDEFGIVLHATTERVASEIAGRLVGALGEYRFIRGGRSFEIGASIGMTTIEACNGDASAVMIEADTACYAAKNLGRGRFHVFRRDDETIVDARRSMGWLHRIQQGFETGGFKLFAQKIMDVTGRTCGYEALLRLDEDGTLYSPAAFLPVAKRFGLVGRIDRLIFQKVFDLLRGGIVLGEDIQSRYISVNMSATSLADPMFRSWLNEMLLRHAEIAHFLWIEITETDEMRWTPAEAEFFAKIRSMGVRLYLDDFGTGYNSFDVLKRIVVDGIKIDRSVVRDIASDPIDQALVMAAISIVADINIDLVAEGVEDQATLEFLSHHGIKRFQGYFFHQPEEAVAQPSLVLSAQNDVHGSNLQVLN